MRKRVILGVLIGCVLVAGAPAAYLYQSMQRVEGHYLSLEDGIRLHYTDEGVGEPVILVHGFAAHIDMNWRIPGTIDGLAKDYRVIALDNRGHGLSSKPHDSDAYGQEMVDDIIRLMDHLEIEKAHVVGYSMGGFITLKLLTQAPERLLSAAPCGMTWQAMTEENGAFLLALATSLEEGGSMQPLFDRLTPEGREMSAFRSATIDFLVGLGNDKLALAKLMRSFPAFEVSEEALRSNTVPTLSIVGSIDPLAESIEEMHAMMSHHELVLLEGEDHISAVRAPGFLKALRAFLKEHSVEAADTPDIFDEAA